MRGSQKSKTQAGSSRTCAICVELVVSSGAEERYEQPGGSADHGRSSHEDDSGADADRPSGKGQLDSELETGNNSYGLRHLKILILEIVDNKEVKGGFHGKFIQLCLLSQALT